MLTQDPTTVAASTYQCPGESHPISQAVHYARMARFYPGCRDCQFRAHTGPLSPKLVERLEETWRRRRPSELWYDEGLAGVYLNQIDAPRAWRAAVALGVYLRQLASAGGSPAVVLASDGRRLTAEVIEAVGDGLRFSGCHVLLIGRATAACLSFAMNRLDADGGLLVGNAPSLPHTVGLKFWGTRGQPLSAGGQLDMLRAIERRPLSRPVRTYGSLRQLQVTAEYLSPQRRHFHALRPLRVLVETTCQSLQWYLHDLAQDVACEFLYLQNGPLSKLALRRSRGVTDSIPRSPALPRPSHGLQQAHFGIWVDGDGESCTVVDEQGQLISGDRLSLLIATHVRGDHPATVAVEDSSKEDVIHALHRIGYDVVSGGNSRESMYLSMCESQATIGGGPSGRHWYGRERPLADALQTLTWLLVVLSQSDRPLSQVVGSVGL